MSFSENHARAAALDRTDPLARFRAEFHLPAGQIYLDGNSLGLLSRPAEAAARRVLDEWRTLGIGGWTDAATPWVSFSETIAAQLAPLLGAAPDEVGVTGSTTSNLHQLLATLFDPAHASRRVILGDELNFPSDAHAIASHLRLRGLDPATHYREVRSRDGRTLREDDIIAAFAPDVQVAVLPSVLFTSGQLLDLARLTREVHARGILIGFDCSHSVGAVPHNLDADDVDFAFWCSYKYLNAGPGAVGGLYLNRRHHTRAPGLAGWWGVAPGRRFAMSHTHEAETGAAALHVGTPHILSVAPLQGALELFTAAGGIAPLREKSLALTAWLIELADTHLAPLGFSVVTPREPARRGGHVSLAHPEAWRLCQALKAAGIVPDFRPPDVVRLAPTALYNSYSDCVAAIERLHHIAHTRSYETFPAQRGSVT
ncbi:MAG: kynureninase [Candidatus Didemnitutus sp.]|nr:kynureninase [Candidatus Didemnitutus sp.]